MSGTVVPLVLPTTFVFDALGASTTVEATLVQRMPVYAWSGGVLVTRVISNTLGVGHRLLVVLRRSAPTPDEPGEDFLATNNWATGGVTSSQPAGFGYFTNISWSNAPPFADLLVELSSGPVPVAGSVRVSIDIVVRGTPFDHIAASELSHQRETR